MVRVPVTDLIGQPGRSRAVSLSVTPADDEQSWGPAEEALASPISVDLHLDAVTDGIVVRGTVAFALRLLCARCLKPLHEQRSVQVAELFRRPRRDLDGADEQEDDPEAEEAYRITADLTAIDLTSMLHDVVVMDVPLRVLCREDCRGLCPRCGADRNAGDCGHDPSPGPDPRWAKLRDLDVPVSHN